MSYSQCAVAALLVTLVVGVQGHQIIYVDTENGTLNSSCWEGGLDQPCGSLELADTGAQKYNSTIAVLLRYRARCNIPTTTPTLPQALSYPPLAATNNGTCGYADNKKYKLVSGQCSNASCPPWFEPFNGTCKCGKTIHDIVKCDETLQKSAVLDCYCMTYNESTKTLVGACFYNCVSTKDTKDVVYRRMPKTVEELNHDMCGDFNRGGQLCGECKANYSPPVYSYDLQCTMCSDGLYNWIKYVAIAFVPLTVFLVLVLCCRINTTSPKLHAFVTFSQALAIPVNVRLLLLATRSYSGASIVLRILATMYGFLNLDFFRAFISHQVCLKVNTLQVIALDYSIAFYPLALIIVTYMLIELHAHNVRFMVWAWKPFHRCFARFRQQWNIKTSVIDAFATFLLLSNIKLLSLSTDLLTPTYVYSMNGSVVDIYLYYDASIEYFGKKHFPYAILALFVVLTFILFPLLLLLLYPMRCFQQCLGLCGVRWHALHIFIDAFQGCYKDGTNGTRDCRYFAAMYLFLRLMFIIVFASIRNGMFCAVVILLLIGVAMLIARVQPYKAEFAAYNAVDSIFILALAMWYGAMVCLSLAAVKAHNLVKVFVVVLFLVAASPLLYLIVIFLCWICSRREIGQRLVLKIKSQIRRRCRRAHGTVLEESLPDRLVNPQLYCDEFCHTITFPMTNSSERFSDQTYSNINNNESASIT